MKSFFGQPGYESVQADLEARLAKLRVDLKVPEVEDEYASGAKKRAGANQGPAKNAKGKGKGKAPAAK